ncbi:MAG: hypothetical protein K6T75_06985 [Acetobacteraceae bacterium]|nr:hypothetical protein [Acetobacteraceae bacterium]
MSEQKGRPLKAVYLHRSVRELGTWLHWALADNDFASLIEFEKAERPEELMEAVRAFLRRRMNDRWQRLDSDDLVELAGLIDDYQVAPVRVAILCHALVRVPKKEKPAAEA